MRFPAGAGQASGLWIEPAAAEAVLVLGHGAGAGMTHRSMAAIAEGLAARRIATLRYNFPYMDHGSKRPDPPAVAQGTARAAIAEAWRRAPHLRLFAGGRSFGGRMTSGAEAVVRTPNLRGLVFFAFPLHPAGRPSVDRAEHLSSVRAPMLFLQGTRDALADIGLLRGVVAGLGPRASLAEFEGADHSFHVPASSGRTDADVMAAIVDRATEWMAKQP